MIHSASACSRLPEDREKHHVEGGGGGEGGGEEMMEMEGEEGRSVGKLAGNKRSKGESDAEGKQRAPVRSYYRLF